MPTGLQMKGFKELQKILQTYEKKTAKAAMRKAVRAGTTIIKSAIKAETPVDEGLLKKAQDMKVGNKGDNFYGVAGADVAKLKTAHEADHDRPTNIDHLVENGHVAPDGRFVPPSGYMRRAAAEALPVANDKVESVLRASIEAMEGS